MCGTSPVNNRHDVAKGLTMTRTNSRVVGCTFVLAVAMILGGCLTKEQRAEAQRLALGDARLAQFLDTHSYVVEEIRRPKGQPQLADGAYVDIVLAEAVDAAEWPLDTCDEVLGPIDGIAWLLDLAEDEVVAVSPLSGTQACFEA
jgi:hypothetical protein